MAFSYSPKIVTDGLVLYLDAANTRSYPGTGTVWSDLSRSGNNGTLINGPTFNSANGGNIVFDGSNDYISTNTNSSLTQAGNTQFTVDVWVKKSASNKDMLLGPWDNSNRKGWFVQWFTDGNLYFGITNGAFNYNYVSVSWQNQWFNLTGVFDGSLLTNQNIGKIYVNNILQNTTNSGNMLTSVPAGLVEVSIGRLTNYSSYATGNITMVKIYNRALSASEISQNYNATKTRFGL